MREEGVNNHPGAISGLIQVLKQDLDISNDDFLICAEHTGQCTYPLPCACKALECSL